MCLSIPFHLWYKGGKCQCNLRYTFLSSAVSVGSDLISQYREQRPRSYWGLGAQVLSLLNTLQWRGHSYFSLQRCLGHSSAVGDETIPALAPETSCCRSVCGGNSENASVPFGVALNFRKIAAPTSVSFLLYERVHVTFVNIQVCGTRVFLYRCIFT